MNRTTSILLLTVLLTVLLCPLVDAWPNIRPLVNTLIIEDISRARIKALEMRDSSAFTKYYEPDFRMTTAWGTVEDVTFLQQWIKTAPPGFTLSPSNYRITVSTDSKMAFATFEMAEVYPDSSGGTPTDITSLYTEIYIYRHRQWLLELAHFSYKS